MVFLSRSHLPCRCGPNGREAVEMCRLAPYELIFMDCQMPEMDGLAAAREIRLLEPHGHQAATIIAMTADYIAKLVKFDRLREAEESWSGRAPV